MNQTKAKKFDKGKAPIGLIPYEFIEMLGKILNFGAARYGRYNWAGGLELMRCYDALIRHAGAWERGEDLDPDSGMSHMGHVAANAMFIYISQLYNLGSDDRWQRPKSEEQQQNDQPPLSQRTVEEVGSQSYPRMQELEWSYGFTRTRPVYGSVPTQETPSSDYPCREEFGEPLGAAVAELKKN